MRWEEITADLRYIEAPEEQKQTIKEDWYEQNIKSNDRYTPEQDPQIRLDLFGEEPAESSGIEEVPKVGFDFGADVGSANVGEAIGENIGKTEQGSARLGQLFGEAFGRGAGPAKIGGAVGEVGGMIANPETREEGLETVKAAGYGAGHMVLKIPEVIGNLIQESGHTRLFSKTPKENILESLIGPSSLLIPYKDLLFRDKKKPALTERDKSLINYGESLVQANREIMDENFSNFLPDPESTGLKRMMYDVGSGGSTLALALGMGIATKNPHLAAGFFGLYQKGQVFGQAMEAGLDPEKASRVSTAAGIVEGGLEYIGLDKFMNMRGDMVWRSVARVLTEGGQEGSQTLGENIITKLGGITPDKSTMDILKEVSYSAMIGMLVASPVSVVVSRAENKGTISFLKNKGLTDTEAKKVVNSVVKESYEQGQAATEDIIDTEQPEIATETPISDEIAPEEGVTPPEVVKEPEKATLTAQEAKSQGMGFEEWSEGRTKAFHGTSADFEEFKISGKGSPYKREAVGPHFGTREQADFVTSTKGDKGKTKEFILDIKNPVRLEDRNSWSHSGVNSQLYEKGIITKEEYEANVYGAEDYDIRETLKAKGYDGIVYNNTAEGPGDSYIAFSNDQIKTETQLRKEWEEAGKATEQPKKVKPKKKPAKVIEEITVEPVKQEATKDGVPTISLDKYTFKGYSTHFNRIKDKFGFEGEVEIDTITLKDQEKRAFDYAQKNPQRAMQIAHGVLKAPPSVFPDAIRSVVMQALIADGKHAQAEDIARKMSKSFTEAAQTLNIAKLNVSNSTKIRHNITEARINKIGQDLGNAKNPQEAVKNEVKKRAKSQAKAVSREMSAQETTIQEIDVLIEELIC